MPDLRKVDSLTARIKELIAKAKQPALTEHLELKAALASHICVLLSGLIEISVQTMCREHCSNKSEKRIADYVSSHLGQFRNPSFERILQLLERFDPAWKEAIKIRCSSEVKTTIDSVVNNRNQISHGEQVGITLASIDAYTNSVLQFVDLLKEVVLNSNEQSKAT